MERCRDTQIGMLKDCMIVSISTEDARMRPGSERTIESP